LFALCAIELHAQGPAIHFREIGKEAGVTKVPFSSKNQHYVVETISVGGAFRLRQSWQAGHSRRNDSTIEQARAGGVPW